MLKDRKMHFTILIMLVVLLPAVLGLLEVIKAQGGVVNYLTYHLNNARTGWNAQETQLTTATVRDLHKLWSNDTIMGQIYAAPLYYNFNGKEMLFIVTQNNYLYVLEADTGAEIYAVQLERPLTQFEFENKLNGSCGDVNPWHGITSTPVIDDRTNTLYLVNLTMESGRQVYKAHAIDILTGEEVSDRWPVTIRGSFENVEFEAWQHTQRGALTLVKENNRLYIPFSSRCDAYNWHGWIFGLDISNPTGPPLVFNTSPDGNGAGIWGPGGMGIDEDGAGYFVTGNGTVNRPVTRSGLSFGMSVLRIDPLNLTRPFSYDPQDYFTISDWGPANARDTDLGGSSALVIPDQKSNTPRLLLTIGKDGRVYLMNRDNLRGLSGELQRMRVNAGGRVAPAYYEDTADGGHFVYVCGSDENQFPAEGTYLDWEDGPISIAPASPPARQRAALGTGPAMVEFQDKLFVAWISNTDDREVLIKSSQDGSNWSSSPVEVGGNAAMRTSPALAAFRGKLYISWIDNDTQRIMVKFSENGQIWSDAQELEEVAETTYTSMAVFNNNLYLAFISSDALHDILLKSYDGQTWSSNTSINSRQIIPVSAPFIIEFSGKLYAFWLRRWDDRDILFKASTSADGRNWPTVELRLGESADQYSGLSGLVLNTIGDDRNPPALRLVLFFVTNERPRRIFSKSLDRLGTVEGSFNSPIFYFRTYESTSSSSKVGAAVFRGRPSFAFVSNNPFRTLLLKRGAAGYKGKGLTALRLTVDKKTGESRFTPAWTSLTHYDYLPGSPFVTSNESQDGMVWVTEGGVKFLPPTLHAYDAVTGGELFNSNSTGDPFDRINTRNNGGRKFVPTVVVNGRVYVASNGESIDRNVINAYGLK